MIEHMATAINYHEQSLRTKALLSFIKFRVLSERERQLVAGCKSRVRHNMLRWYFQAIIKKFQEIKWIESGKQIAMLYKVKVTLRKVLYAWQDTIKAEKHHLSQMRHALSKNLKTVEILMNMAGKFYSEKSYFNVLDIDEFRINAYNQGRVLQRNNKTFDTYCVRLTVKRLKEFFHTWRQFTDSLI